MLDINEPNRNSVSTAPNIENNIGLKRNIPLVEISDKRLKTVAFSKYLIDSDKTVFLDTETTGLRKTDEICELAIVNSKGEVLFDKMFKPQVSMDPAASAVSGITDEMLKDKPDFSVYSSEIQNILKDKIIVGWNIPFDEKMIENTFRTHNQEFSLKTNNLIYDAMRLSMDYYETAISLKQNEVMQAFGSKHQENHRAVDDVIDMIEVVKCMADINFDAKDIIDFVPDKKKDKLTAERKYGSSGTVNIDGKARPVFAKYVETFGSLKNIQATADALQVSPSTVRINLMKAIYHNEMNYSDFEVLPREEYEKASELLTKMGFTQKDCFDSFCKQCGGYNFRTYTDKARQAGVPLTSVYHAALLRSITPDQPQPQP